MDRRRPADHTAFFPARRAGARAGDEVLIDRADGDRLLAAFHPAVETPSRAASSPCLAERLHGRAAYLVACPRGSGGGLQPAAGMRGAGPARPLAKGTYNACAGADLVPSSTRRRRVTRMCRCLLVAHSLGGTAALDVALVSPRRRRGWPGLSPSARRSTWWRHHGSSPQVSGLWPAYAAGAETCRRHRPGHRQRHAGGGLLVAKRHRIRRRVTAPMAGHRNAAAYYRASSVHERMQDIATRR